MNDSNMRVEDLLAPITIRLKQLSGDNTVGEELGLEMIMLGEFFPTNQPFSERQLIPISDNDFDAVMARQNIQLPIEVEIQWGRKTVFKQLVTLKFQKLDAFSPDSVFMQLREQVKAFEFLWQFRQGLLDIRDSVNSNPVFTAALESAVKLLQGSSDLPGVYEALNNRLMPPS